MRLHVFFIAENKTDSDDESEPIRHAEQKVSEMEKIWRSESIDYKLFYCGHCNTTTDIKEANFFGRLFAFVYNIETGFCNCPTETINFFI